jgi:hypothetical protein
MSSGDQSALAKHVVHRTTGVESDIGTAGYDEADGSDADVKLNGFFSHKTIACETKEQLGSRATDIFT